MKKIIVSALTLLLVAACTSEKKPEGQVVHSVLEANISGLDPIHSTNKYASTICGSLFEGLYHYHYLKRPIELEPQLAESMPTISKDGKTYTIKIKKGVYFHNDPAFKSDKGRELVAQDFIYSWKRLADPKNKALGWFLLDGLIVGLNEWRDDMRKGEASYATAVKGLKAIAPHTLQIELNRPSYQFLHLLATPPTTVVAKEVVDEYGPEIVNHPIGTGPYILKNWVRNSEVVLEKNPNYRPSFYPKTGADDSQQQGLLKHAGERLPLSDKVVVRIMPEKQPIWLSFLKGELDHGFIPKDNYDQIVSENELNKEYRDKGIRLYQISRPDVTYVAFNMEHPLLGKNLNLRKAFAAAIDKDIILKKFYNSRGIIAQSPIPPELDAYDPTYKSPISFNLEDAKKYLAAAGYPEGQGLPVFDYELSTTATWARQYGELIKDQLSRVGIQIKLNTNTWPQFDKKLKTKKATLFDMAWMADYPDSQNFLQLFYSKNISPGSNNFNYINRDYDKIYEQAVALAPGPERDKLFRKLVDIINRDIPAIFVIHRTYQLPYHSWLENYHEYPIFYDHLQYLYVNQDKKNKMIEKL